MSNSSKTRNIISWVFAILFLGIGILNIFMVHPVPGLIYIAIASIYLPGANTAVRKNLGFTIPFAAKLIIGILAMWFTLGVGDLMEIFEARYL